MNIERLEKLAQQYEDNARAIRLTIQLATHADAVAAGKALPRKLAAAARLRGQPVARVTKYDAVVSVARRAWLAGESIKTKDVVDQVAADHGIKVTASHVLNTLNRIGGRKDAPGNKNAWLPPAGQPDELTAAVHGTNGNGNGHRPGGRTSHASNADTKRQMVDLVARFDHKRPCTSADMRARLVADGMSDDQARSIIRGIGPMVRRGYLRKRKDGYIATSKPYQPFAAAE